MFYDAYDGEQVEFPIHRLLAVAEYGFDSIAGLTVHHQSHIPWDNRPEKLELMTKSEHQTHHNIKENNGQSP